MVSAKASLAGGLLFLALGYAAHELRASIELGWTVLVAGFQMGNPWRLAAKQR